MATSFITELYCLNRSGRDGHQGEWQTLPTVLEQPCDRLEEREVDQLGGGHPQLLREHCCIGPSAPEADEAAHVAQDGRLGRGVELGHVLVGQDKPKAELAALGEQRAQRALVAGVAEAPGADVQAGIRRAAAAAAQDAHDRHDGPLPPDDESNAVVLDVEVMTDVELIQPVGLSGLLFALEPGIHGLVLQDGERSAGGWPADALRGGRSSARWTKALLAEVRPPGVRLPASTRVARFRTRQVVGMLRPPSDRPVRAVPMQGATRVVPLSSVTRQDLGQAAGRAGSWLARHQRKNGLFAYSFVERTRSWSPDDSLVRQAGCAWAMTRLARLIQDPGFVQPAGRALQGLERTALKRGGPGNLAYLQAAGGPPRLGAIPLFLLAADEWTDQSPIAAATRDRLTATLLAVQQPSGAFGTQARGLELEGSETYYAGQIALALARRFALTRRDRPAEVGRRAIRYYRDWWHDGNQDLSFLTWMLQACEAWHLLSPDNPTRDFAFEMADWALQFQHGPDHPNPLWVGAFESTPGIGTAAYTEGLTRALALARRVNDAERIERYEASVRHAVRFLLQLSMEDADLAFVGGPEHRGAVRSSLRRRNLRCDNAQHFIMSTLGAAGELFRDPDPAPA